MFGDAGSPYLVGLLSQSFRSQDNLKELPAPVGQKFAGDSGLQIYAQIAENTTSLVEGATSTISSMMPTSMTTAATPRFSITVRIAECESWECDLMEWFLKLNFQETEDEFTALQYALFIMCFIEVVGAALFFVTSFYVVRDKQNVDIAIQGELELVVDGWMDFCSIRGG